jgi:hypothetical protein
MKSFHAVLHGQLGFIWTEAEVPPRGSQACQLGGPAMPATLTTTLLLGALLTINIVSADASDSEYRVGLINAANLLGTSLDTDVAHMQGGNVLKTGAPEV